MSKEQPTLIDKRLFYNCLIYPLDTNRPAGAIINGEFTGIEDIRTYGSLKDFGLPEVKLAKGDYDRIIKLMLKQYK